MSISQVIDHTCLRPDATSEDIKKLVDEALQYEFWSVCVNPCWVSLAANLLRDSDVHVCTVIGFPLGATTPEVKAYEAQNAVANGADEVDMVLNVGALKSGDNDLVKRDIEQVVCAVKGRALVKVILETCLLSDAEIILASQVAAEAGADFVKTSTGFSTGGATTHAVSLMRQTVGDKLGVKASGGIHSYEEAQAMLEAGASRLGCSAGVAIVSDEIKE